MFEAVFVDPALEHLVPAIDAEKAGIEMSTNDEANEMTANFQTRAMSIAWGYNPYMVILKDHT